MAILIYKIFWEYGLELAFSNKQEVTELTITPCFDWSSGACIGTKDLRVMNRVHRIKQHQPK